MSEELLVQQCSPTLAGLKTGSLFSCSFQTRQELQDCLRSWNQSLGKKGLRVILLRVQNSRALIYVFRPSQLSRDLRNADTSALLSARGYTCDSSEGCIRHLIHRLNHNEEFPHEIGLFLGYPPEDVSGFIENPISGYKCVGCWKVYGDADAAQARFSQFKTCTAAYCAQLADGQSIEQLAVAD